MPGKTIRKDTRIIKGSISAVLFLLLAISYFYDPVNYKIVDCSFKHITGVSCPGCGLSRSFHSFAHFDLYNSFGFHLLGPVFFLLIASIAIIFAIEALNGIIIIKGVTNQTWKWIFILTLAIWIAYWIVRMLIEIYYH